MKTMVPAVRGVSLTKTLPRTEASLSASVPQPVTPSSARASVVPSRNEDNRLIKTTPKSFRVGSQSRAVLRTDAKRDAQPRHYSRSGPVRAIHPADGAGARSCLFFQAFPAENEWGFALTLPEGLGTNHRSMSGGKQGVGHV